MPRPEPSRGTLDLAAQALAHADALHDLARHLAASDADAEDLVQETYVRAFAALDRIEDPGNLGAWLCRILRNAFLSRLRRSRNDPVEPGLDLSEPAADAAGPPLRGDPELAAMRRLVAKDIEAALRALSEDARTTVLLDAQGYREAEIAAILGCAQGTVKSRLARARAELRERLADYARTGAP